MKVPSIYDLRKASLMEKNKKSPTTVDEYIAQAPREAQPILQKIRAIIKEAAPQAQEKISYKMPGYFDHGQLVWFGVHTQHIGFYPTGEGVEAFKEELSAFKTSKGAVQFPLDQPIPYELIRRIVAFKLAENLKNRTYAERLTA
jgi:uncharacterized protein YdhG (YjbR/CyaY superfamily)